MLRKNLLATSAVALVTMVGGPVWAQGVEGSAVTGLTGTTAFEERFEDVEEDVEEEFERSQDEARFGTAAVEQGFNGSVSASLDTSSGNTDTTDFGLGARFTFGQGRLNHSFGAIVEYGEDSDERSENNVFAIYDATYDITDRIYGFGLARAEYDEFDSLEKDFFLGFGPGYRILNRPDLAWRVQAGPGIRYTENQADEEDTSIAGIVGSRFYYQFSPSMFLTNDTDVLFSDENTGITNDLGLNISLQGPFSMRAGLWTDYNTDPLPGFESTDNSLSAALVYTLP